MLLLDWKLTLTKGPKMPRPKQTYDPDVLRETVEFRNREVKRRRYLLNRFDEQLDAEYAKKRREGHERIHQESLAERAIIVRRGLRLGVPAYVLRRELNLTNWKAWLRELGPDPKP